jgi:hypothetical protein
MRSFPYLAILNLVIISLCPWQSDCQLSVSPTIIETKAYPGGLQRFTVTISNMHTEILDCKIEVAALRVAEGGLPVAVDDAPRSCRDWLNVSPREFSLNVKQGRRLICQVRPPRNTGGGYYAIIICTAKPRTVATTTAVGREKLKVGIRFSYRTMIPILLTVPGAGIRSMIDAARPQITWNDQQPGYTFKLPVRNRGNMHTRMLGEAEIRSEAGQSLEKFALQAGRGLLLPGHERLFTSKSSINIPDGVYNLRLTLTAEKRSRPMKAEFSFHIKDGTPSVAKLSSEQQTALQARSSAFVLSPPQVDIRIPPGSRRTQAVEISNLSRQPINVRAAPLEWVRNPETGDAVIAATPFHQRSGSPLISLPRSEFTLRPLAKSRIPINVALPREAVGEYYAALCFDRADIELDASPSGRLRRSVLIRMISGKGSQYGMEVEKLTATRKPSGVVEILLRYKNTSNVGMTPEVEFIIRDSQKKIVGRKRTQETLAFTQAGGEGVASIEWTQVLAPGSYTVEAAARYDPNNPPLTSRADFIITAFEESK